MKIEEIKIIEMKEEGYSLKKMKEKFEELESKYHFDDCWEKVHTQPENKMNEKERMFLSHLVSEITGWEENGCDCKVCKAKIQILKRTRLAFMDIFKI